MREYARLSLAVVVGMGIGLLIDTPVRGTSAAAAGEMEGRFGHVGFAVKDAVKSARAFADVFGIAETQKPQDYHNALGGTRYPGKIMHGRRAGVVINGLTFEFFEPLEGENPWREFIEKYGEGIQHLAYSVPDVRAARLYLESKGGVHTLAVGDDAAYVDMSAAGLPITFELGPLKK